MRGSWFSNYISESNFSLQSGQLLPANDGKTASYTWNQAAECLWWHNVFLQMSPKYEWGGWGQVVFPVDRHSAIDVDNYAEVTDSHTAQSFCEFITSLLGLLPNFNRSL